MNIEAKHRAYFYLLKEFHHILKSLSSGEHKQCHALTICQLLTETTKHNYMDYTGSVYITLLSMLITPAAHWHFCFAFSLYSFCFFSDKADHSTAFHYIISRRRFRGWLTTSQAAYDCSFIKTISLDADFRTFSLRSSPRCTLVLLLYISLYEWRVLKTVIVSNIFPHTLDRKIVMSRIK